FKQIRAKIAQQQAAAGVSLAEREKTDREVKEFLNQPEVKEKYEKLKQARQKQRCAAEKMLRLEAEDPTLPLRMAGMPVDTKPSTASSSKSAPKTATKTPAAQSKSQVAPFTMKPTTDRKVSVAALPSMAGSSVDATPLAELPSMLGEFPAPSTPSVDDKTNRIFAWSRARQENESLGREAMETLSSVNESLDKFAANHPKIAKMGGLIVDGIGYAAMAGTLYTAAQGGILPLMLSGSSILASNEVMAAVLEHGSEYLVKEAASLGKTEAEAVRFGTNMAGAIDKVTFLGATKLAVKAVKGGKGAIKNLSLSEATAVSKEAFVKKQIAPAESHANISRGITETIESNPLLKAEIARLLPGEGKVGTYGELLRAGKKGDNITPDHVPSAAYMWKNFGVKKEEAIAINVEHPHPGVGGRHRETRTFGKSPSDLAPRSELAADISDLRGIYQDAGLYTPEIRRGLMDLSKQNQSAFPEIFSKKSKK
ncbi:MAG: hypothetical protein LBP41_02935, partial [Holosporaceae bacterium]|nr:hypothetical protein [Holosporaceae bacterium]